MPRMLGDIVAETVVAERDMELVGKLRGTSSLLHSVQRSNPHVVVLGGHTPSLAASLLEKRPRLKVLAVTDYGLESWLYELRPNRVRLGEVSPHQLIHEIREATEEQAAWAWWA